jgi:hypothetical protein
MAETRTTKWGEPWRKQDRPRKPIPALDALYEITWSGDIYSVRLGRFIQHTWSPAHKKSFIDVQIRGERRTMSIADAVEDAWGIRPPWEGAEEQ